MGIGQNIDDLPRLDLDTSAIINRIYQHNRRVLLFGPMGIGKSTVVAQLAKDLYNMHRTCYCLNADPVFFCKTSTTLPSCPWSTMARKGVVPSLLFSLRNQCTIATVSSGNNISSN